MFISKFWINACARSHSKAMYRPEHYAVQETEAKQHNKQKGFVLFLEFLAHNCES